MRAENAWKREVVARVRRRSSRRSLTWQAAVIALACGSSRAGAAFFSSSTPPDGNVFRYTPGSSYTFPPNNYSIDIIYSSSEQRSSSVTYVNGQRDQLYLVSVGSYIGSASDHPERPLGFFSQSTESPSWIYNERKSIQCTNVNLANCTKWKAWKQNPFTASVHNSTNKTSFSFQFSAQPELSQVLNVWNPFYSVCVSFGGTVDSTANNFRCWAIIIDVPPKLYTTANFSNLSSPLFGYNGSLASTSVAINQDFVGYLYFYDMNNNLTGAGDVVTSVFVDRSTSGLPNGAQLVMDGYFSVYVSEGAYYQVYIAKFAFRPTSWDTGYDSNAVLYRPTGLLYTVSFIAKSSGEYGEPLDSNSQSIKIQILNPLPYMEKVIPLAPMDSYFLDFSDIPGHGNVTNLYIRCQYCWHIYMQDRNNDNLSYVRYQDDFSAGYERNFYFAIAQWSAKGQVPVGTTLYARGAEPWQKLCWKPPQSISGSLINLCLDIFDQGVKFDYISEISKQGPINYVTYCAKVLVAKCKFCVLPKDTLKNVAYELRANWLQMWAANMPYLKTPDNLKNYTILNVGPLYHMPVNESATELSGRFQMTMSSFKFANPDLVGEYFSSLTDVCIMPTICAW